MGLTGEVYLVCTALQFFSTLSLSLICYFVFLILKKYYFVIITRHPQQEMECLQRKRRSQMLRGNSKAVDEALEGKPEESHG